MCINECTGHSLFRVKTQERKSYGPSLTTIALAISLYLQYNSVVGIIKMWDSAEAEQSNCDGLRLHILAVLPCGCNDTFLTG